MPEPQVTAVPMGNYALMRGKSQIGTIATYVTSDGVEYCVHIYGGRSMNGDNLPGATSSFPTLQEALSYACARTIEA